jgi:hypothetical protein
VSFGDLLTGICSDSIRFWVVLDCLCVGAFVCVLRWEHCGPWVDVGTSVSDVRSMISASVEFDA